MIKFRFLKELMLIRQVNQKNGIYVTTGIFKINDGITILTILLFWTFAIFIIIISELSKSEAVFNTQCWFQLKVEHYKI